MLQLQHSAHREGQGLSRRRAALEEVEGWHQAEPYLSVGEVHEQLRQLAEDEAQLLDNVAAYDHRDIKEYYWTEKVAPLVVTEFFCPILCFWTDETDPKTS